MEIVLERLSDLDATLTGARISSDTVIKLVLEKRIDPSLSPEVFRFPCAFGARIA